MIAKVSARAKLSGGVCAAILLLSGSGAGAQPSSNAVHADERADRAASLADDRKMAEANAQIRRNDVLVDKLLHRAAHEEGQRRDTDMAEVERLKAQTQAERDKITAIKANNQATMKNYHSDLNDKPH